MGLDGLGEEATVHKAHWGRPVVHNPTLSCMQLDESRTPTAIVMTYMMLFPELGLLNGVVAPKRSGT